MTQLKVCCVVGNLESTISPHHYYLQAVYINEKQKTNRPGVWQTESVVKSVANGVGVIVQSLSTSVICH